MTSYGILTVLVIFSLLQSSFSFHYNRFNVNFKLRTALKSSSETVDDIAARWKLVKYGQGQTLRYGVEQLPSNTHYQKPETITVSTEGGIGLELVEVMNMGDNIGGMVMVEGVREGSNAEKCGKFLVGDVIVALDADSVEGLNYDLCLDQMIKRVERGPAELKITVQRLIRAE